MATEFSFSLLLIFLQKPLREFFKGDRIPIDLNRIIIFGS